MESLFLCCVADQIFTELLQQPLVYCKENRVSMVMEECSQEAKLLEPPQFLMFWNSFLSRQTSLKGKRELSQRILNFQRTQILQYVRLTLKHS